MLLLGSSSGAEAEVHPRTICDRSLRFVYVQHFHARTVPYAAPCLVCLLVFTRELLLRAQIVFIYIIQNLSVASDDEGKARVYFEQTMSTDCHCSFQSFIMRSWQPA